MISGCKNSSALPVICSGCALSRGPRAAHAPADSELRPGRPSLRRLPRRSQPPAAAARACDHWTSDGRGRARTPSRRSSVATQSAKEEDLRCLEHERAQCGLGAVGSRSAARSSVNRLGYGAMRITGPGVWAEPADPEEARRVLRRAVELGVDLIDTAAAYGPEVSERLIAEALYPYPEGFVVATKSGFQRTGPNQMALPTWPTRDDPARLRAQPQPASSGDDRTLYQFHIGRPEGGATRGSRSGTRSSSCGAEGKVRMIGVSNCERRSARASAERRPRSSRCRTVSALATARATRCSRPARATASPSCPGIHSARARSSMTRRLSRWLRRTTRHPRRLRSVMAARTLPGVASDSRNLVARPSRGEHRGRRNRALGRGFRAPLLNRTTEVLIRDAEPDDVPGIVGILNDAIAHTTAVWSERPLTLEEGGRWLLERRAAGSPVLVAADATGAVGFASFGEFRPWTGYHPSRGALDLRARRPPRRRDRPAPARRARATCPPARQACDGRRDRGLERPVAAPTRAGRLPPGWAAPVGGRQVRAPARPRAHVPPARAGSRTRIRRKARASARPRRRRARGPTRPSRAARACATSRMPPPPPPPISPGASLRSFVPQRRRADLPLSRRGAATPDGTTAASGRSRRSARATVRSSGRPASWGSPSGSGATAIRPAATTACPTGSRSAPPGSRPRRGAPASTSRPSLLMLALRVRGLAHPARDAVHGRPQRTFAQGDRGARGRLRRSPTRRASRRRRLGSGYRELRDRRGRLAPAAGEARAPSGAGPLSAGQTAARATRQRRSNALAGTAALSGSQPSLRRDDGHAMKETRRIDDYCRVGHARRTMEKVRPSCRGIAGRRRSALG